MDPDEWLTELEDMRGQLLEMDTEIINKDFVIHVLGNLPDKYKIDVSKMEDRIGKDLMTNDVCETLNLQFEESDKEEEGNNEEALVVARLFKGKC